MADWPDDGEELALNTASGRGNLDGARAARLLELVSAGNTVPKACNACGVSRPAFWSLHARDGAFRDAVYQARLMGVEVLADEILEIADDRLLDPRDRAIKIDARKWILTKLMPRRYGDKVDLHVTQGKRVEQMTDVEIDAEIQRLRAAGAAGGEEAPPVGSDEPPRIH